MEIKTKKTVTFKKINTKQQDLINEFTESLKPAHFIVNSDEQVYLKTVIIPNYLKRLKKEFTVNQIGQTFYSLRGAVFQDDDTNGGGGLRNCDCNKNSMISCQALNTPSCEKKSCEEVSNNCGFMWAYDCNGVCRKI